MLLLASYYVAQRPHLYDGRQRSSLLYSKQGKQYVRQNNKVKIYTRMCIRDIGISGDICNLIYRYIRTTYSFLFQAFSFLDGPSSRNSSISPPHGSCHFFLTLNWALHSRNSPTVVSDLPRAILLPCTPFTDST